MRIRDIMERVGYKVATRRAIAYIKDGLEEMNLFTPSHVKTTRINIVKDQRFYDMPFDMIKLIDVRCKDHKNEDNTYRSIPRMAHEPFIVDTDGN